MVNVSFCRLGRIIPEPFAGYILPYVRKMIARTDGAVPCTVLGAIWNGLACAAAVVTWNEEESVGELRSLFVDPTAQLVELDGPCGEDVMAEEHGFAVMLPPEGDGARRVRYPCGIKTGDQFIAFCNNESVSVLRRLIAERLDGGKLRVRKKERIPPIVQDEGEEFGEIVARFRGNGAECA